MFFVCAIGCMFGTNIDSLYGSKSFLHRVIFLVSTLICLVLQIHSLDISAGGALGVSASSDGHLRIWETATGIVRVSISKLFTQNNLKAVLCSCQCDDEPLVPQEWWFNVHRSDRLLYTMTDPSVTRVTHLFKTWLTRTVNFLCTISAKWLTPDEHAPALMDLVTVLLTHMGLWRTCASVLWLLIKRSLVQISLQQ